MRFSQAGLHSVFSEIRRILKPNGLNYFSVRNHNDKFHGAGVEVEEGIYEINGFEGKILLRKGNTRFDCQRGFQDALDERGI